MSQHLMYSELHWRTLYAFLAEHEGQHYTCWVLHCTCRRCIKNL